MNKWKIIGKKLFFLPLWLIILLSLVSAIALVMVFVNKWEENPIAYAVYTLSAYSLTVVCIFTTIHFPKLYAKIKNRIYTHPFGNKYMTDAVFKVQISLYISLTINIIYSVFKLVSGIVYSSFWWGAVAVYYIMLSLLRFLLLRYMRTDKEKQGLLNEYKRYRLCGILMLILNLALTAIVFQMVWQNKGYTYPGTLIFLAAAYTFYTVTGSIIDIVKYRKYKSPVLSASKAIKFAAALVSLLSLETAMLAQFGNDENYRRIMTALTGSGVCLIVLAVSIFMIVRSNKEIKKLQS